MVNYQSFSNGEINTVLFATRVAKPFSWKKMEVLKKLQSSKPYHGFCNLSIGYHSIKEFRFVKNKYAKKHDGSTKSILVELANEVLFLPQHFNQKINQSELEELNSCIKKGEAIFLYFGGKEDQSKWVNRIFLFIFSVHDKSTWNFLPESLLLSRKIDFNRFFITHRPIFFFLFQGMDRETRRPEAERRRRE